MVTRFSDFTLRAGVGSLREHSKRPAAEDLLFKLQYSIAPK